MDRRVRGVNTDRRAREGSREGAETFDYDYVSLGDLWMEEEAERKEEKTHGAVLEGGG
jgi:hypothetical protein